MQEVGLQWMMYTLRWVNISNISANLNQLMSIATMTSNPELEWPRKECSIWYRSGDTGEYTKGWNGTIILFGHDGSQKGGLWRKLTRKGSNQHNCGLWICWTEGTVGLQTKLFWQSWTQPDCSGVYSDLLCAAGLRSPSLVTQSETTGAGYYKVCDTEGIAWETPPRTGNIAKGKVR